jgi:hypothetical protein
MGSRFEHLREHFRPFSFIDFVQTRPNDFQPGMAFLKGLQVPLEPLRIFLEMYK